MADDCIFCKIRDGDIPGRHPSPQRPLLRDTRHRPEGTRSPARNSQSSHRVPAGTLRGRARGDRRHVRRGRPGGGWRGRRLLRLQARGETRAGTPTRPSTTSTCTCSGEGRWAGWPDRVWSRNLLSFHTERKLTGEGITLATEGLRRAAGSRIDRLRERGAGRDPVAPRPGFRTMAASS